MSMLMNNEIFRTELRHRLERDDDRAAEWARVEGWRGVRIRRSRRRGPANPSAAA